tara:strand:- start:90 stop:716 length:627 start_codon:yes stop_codon:yes gene_type:complete
MKKILSIFILSLLLSGNAYSAEREVLESNAQDAWKVDGKFIVPECLIYEWYSGDNYEKFYETYFKKEAKHSDLGFRYFIENIGLFLNKKVPLNHSIKGWGVGPEEISLTKNVSDCVSDTPETYVSGLYVGVQTGYKVIKSIDVKEGKELAPNIKEEFISIKLIERSHRPGSMGTRWHYNIYGIINLNGEKVILPLLNMYADKSIRQKF